MEKELERAHNGNTRKELIIAEMKLKLDGLRMEETSMRTKIHKTSELIKSFNRDFYQLTQLIQEPRALKDAVKELNKKYGTHRVKIVPVDQDLKKELTRQREYLERNVEGLQRKLAKDTSAYHKSHLVIMQENVILINELNELRRELKVMKLNAHRGPQFKSEDSASMAKEIEAMRTRINEMQLQMRSKQDQVTQLETMLQNREGNDERAKVHLKGSENTKDVLGMANIQLSNTLNLDESNVGGPQLQLGQDNADTTLEKSSMLKYAEVMGGAETGKERDFSRINDLQEVHIQEQIHDRRTSSPEKAPSATELNKKDDIDQQACDKTSQKEPPLLLISSNQAHVDGDALQDISAAEGTSPHPAQPFSDTHPMALRISVKETHTSFVQGSDPPQPRTSGIDTMSPRSSVQDAHKSMAQGSDSLAPLESDVVPMVPRTSVKDTSKSSVEGGDTSKALESEEEAKAPRASIKEDQQPSK